MTTSTPTPILEKPAPPPAREEPPFGVNEMRLSALQWLVAFAIVTFVLVVTPKFWKGIERFDTPRDYRMPYALSDDYWLYGWRCEKLPPDGVIVLGDSVIWGEYVLPDGTLPHFLSQETGQPDRFINCGVNGLFPLAMEGLIEHYAPTLHHRKIILHCNLLWMTSPKADLSVSRELTFNHSRLVPQFSPRIPCYRADAAERLSVQIERNVPFSSWVGHLQSAYYNHKSIPRWTLEDDGATPPRLLHAAENPIAPITLKIPADPSPDPQRGPDSPRHISWQANGAIPEKFDWVPLDKSLQWKAFQRTVELLKSRGNDVLVIVGPFNQHMIAPAQRPTFGAMCDQVGQWLSAKQIPVIIPDPLPPELYADASHPLTQGYAALAQQIARTPVFRTWIAARGE